MIQLVKKNLTRERGGDELYLGKAFFSSLSWAPGGGGFRRWRGDEQWGCVAVGSGGSPAWLDGGGGAPARRCASAGQAAPWRGGSAAPEGVRDCPGLRGSERSRCPAPRPCLADRFRARPGAGQRGDAVPFREPGRAGLGVGGSRGAGGELHRRLREGAGGAGSRHRRHRRCGARPSGGALLPRLLRPLLLPAAVCVRRRSPAGGLSAAGRYRPGEACRGGIEASDRAAASGLARGPHRGAGRIRASAAGG